MTAEHNRAWVSGARVITFVSLVAAYAVQVVFPLYRPYAWWVAGGAIAGFLMGRYVEPSLDKANGTTMAKELDFIGFVMSQYWVLYAVFVRLLSALIGLDQLRPRDTGSILSRSIVPGTLLRMAFADVPLYLAAWMAGIIFNFSVPQGPWLWQLLAGQFIGLGLSDAIHLIIWRGEHARQQSEPNSTRAGTGRGYPERARRGPRER